MSKNTCIVNGNEFQIEKTEFHLEDLVKKIIKDKKIRVKKIELHSQRDLL